MPKGLPWFRLYSEFAFDPKIQTMSETFQRRFVMIMCLKCNGDIPGLTDETASCALRISPDELLKTKKLFIDMGLILEDYEIVKWSERQYRSDSSTDRVHKFRNKKRETLQKRKCNGNVTAPSVSVSVSKSVSFIKPNIEELREYIKEKSYNINPEKFMAYYESNGWMVGKNKMKSWKAALVTWSHSDYNKPKPSRPGVTMISTRTETRAESIEILKELIASSTDEKEIADYKKTLEELEGKHGG
jgi:hypothetical protein